MGLSVLVADAVEEVPTIGTKEMALMSKVRLVLLSLVAVLSVGAMYASTASAEIEFKWKVAGAELKTGESLGFTVNNDSKKFTLETQLSGIALSLLSSNVSVAAGAKIIGGVPGTNEETAIFKEVTGDGALGGCTTLQVGGAPGVVTTTPLKTEIVEGASAKVGNNEVLILFTPKTGETFATFEIINVASCGFVGLSANVSGLVLALALPQKTEVLRQNLVFEAVTKEYKNHAKEFKTAGLIFNNLEPAKLLGLVLVVLDHDEVFGPF